MSQKIDLDEVKKLNVKKGDVLVFSYDSVTGPEIMKVISKYLGVKCIVIQDVNQVGVVKFEDVKNIKT